MPHPSGFLGFLSWSLALILQFFKFKRFSLKFMLQNGLFCLTFSKILSVTDFSKKKLLVKLIFVSEIQSVALKWI